MEMSAAGNCIKAPTLGRNLFIQIHDTNSTAMAAVSAYAERKFKLNFNLFGGRAIFVAYPIFITLRSQQLPSHKYS